MAKPQVEHGHVRIANDLFEALCRAPLSGRQFRVALAVLRETYGWSRKCAVISQSRLSQVTGISHKPSLTAITGTLEDHKIIICEHRHGKPTLFSVNKDYEQWSTVPSDETSRPGETSPIEETSRNDENSQNPSSTVPSDGTSRANETSPIDEIRTSPSGETSTSRIEATSHLITTKYNHGTTSTPPYPPTGGRAGSDSSFSGEEEDLPPLLTWWHNKTTRFPTPKDRQFSHEMMSRGDWNEALAVAACELGLKEYRAANDGQLPRGVMYFRNHVIRALESGEMPGQNGKRRSEPEPEAERYPTVEEINAREEAQYAELRARRANEPPVDFATADKFTLRGMAISIRQDERRPGMIEKYGNQPAFVTWYNEIAAQEGWDVLSA